jgi:hypothetical protein
LHFPSISSVFASPDPRGLVRARNKSGTGNARFRDSEEG